MAEIQTAKEETHATIRSGKMWFGWSISLWEAIFFWVTAVAAVAGAVSVTAAFLSAIVGFKISDEVTRGSATALERYKADAGKLIAEANARASEAQLALEKYRAPRTLSVEQQDRITEAVKGFAGQEYALSVAPGQEALNLLEQIDASLHKAGWVRTDAYLSGIQVATSVGPAGVNTPSGIAVRAPMAHIVELAAPLAAVVNAIQAEGIAAVANQDPSLLPSHKKALNVMVGTKP